MKSTTFSPFVYLVSFPQAQRIVEMRKEFDINIENAYLIVNRLSGEMPSEIKTFIEKMDVPLLGTIPADDDLSAFEFSGRPLIELGDQSPVYEVVAKMRKFSTPASS